MKTLQEIENTGFERLEQIAREDGVRVPRDLQASVRESVAAVALASAGERKPARAMWLTYALLSMFAAACLATFFVIPRTPKDTFDDPLLAYAKVEETFALISKQMDRGVQSALLAEESLETVDRIINNTK